MAKEKKRFLKTQSEYENRVNCIVSEFKNINEVVYKNDKEMINGCNYLCSILESTNQTKSNEKFVNDLWGFMQWANQTKQEASRVLTTIYHDIGEFNKNRFEKWFCPRSTGYSKYLIGVTKI